MKKRLLLLALAALWLTAAKAQQFAPGVVPEPTADTSGFATGNVQLSGPGAFLLADLKQGMNPKQLTQRYVLVKQGAENHVPAFVELAAGATRQELESLGVKVQSGKGSVMSVLVPLSSYEELVYSGIVARIDVSERNTPMLNRVREAANVDSVYNGLRLPRAYTGAGVVVGVVDIGFEYGHPAFYDSTGTTLRVKRVWEQTASTGSHPSGFTYGRELATASDILAAANSSTTETHGTHVAGIAAGCGGNTAAMRAFRGIAPEADLVLVSTNMSSTGIYDGIEYIGRYAASVGKPCVINLSLGSHVGPHDGTSSFDRACDSYLASYGNGLLLVGAAGNEGADKLHISKTFSANDTLLYAIVDFDGSSAGSTTIDLWSESGSYFLVGLGIINTSTARFEAGGYFRHSQAYYTYSESLTDADGEVTTATVYCNGVDRYNGRQNISISLNNSNQTSDNQRVILVLKARTGTVHMWGNKCTFVKAGLTGITEGNTNYTVSETGGSGNSMITVGAYTTRNSWTSRAGTPFDISQKATVGDIAYFSSRGPRLDGHTKPDITAPGQMTIAPINRFNSSYCNSGYATHAMTFNGNTEYFGAMQGTSMSTPVVTGILALWLQSDTSLNPTKALQLLKSTAVSDSYTGTIPQAGSNTWGYGKIDAYAGLDTTSAPEALDTATCLITSLPYTQDFENGAKCWGIRNSNSNGLSWGVTRGYGYNQSACAYVNDTASGDWFISPRIIVAGDIAVDWKVASLSVSTVESYRVWLLTSSSSYLIYGESLNDTNFADRTAYWRIAAGDTAQIVFQYLSNTRGVLLIDDFAIRSANLYALSATSNSTTQGSVSGGGYYVPDAQVTITANAAAGYRFTCWQDGSAVNPRSFVLTGDTAFTAYFEVDTLTQTTLAAIDTSKCLITSLPYVMNFDTTIDCWSLYDANSDGTRWGLIRNYGVNSSKCMFINPRSNSNDYLYSPKCIVTGHMALDWKARSYYASLPNTYAVYLVTSKEGAKVLFTETLASSSYVSRSVDFDVAVGDTSWIIFRYLSDSMSAFFIDDFTLRRVSSPVQYTLTVASADPAQGTATGGGTFDVGSTATLTATPLTGYHFLRWQDGNTDNPRSVIVTCNATYTAYFEADNAPVQYTLTANSANIMQGMVSGGGTYNSGSTATLTATAASGYHFLRWQDGNTDNPRSIVVTQDSNFVAYFEADQAPEPTQFTLTVQSANPAQGTVSGGGVYSTGATATLTATPASGFHFLRWQDGNTDNPRTLIVRANATHTAYFESDTNISYFTIVVSSSDSSQGIAYGGGTYSSVDSATLIATPFAGYMFVGWSDGSMANPRKMAVRANGTYAAYFGPDPFPATAYRLTVASNDASQGTVKGGGRFSSGTVAVITATAQTGYRFVKWQDENTDNPRILTVTADATYTAYFEPDGTLPQYTITVESADMRQGTVTGGGTYYSGTTITLTATAASGYHFLRWNDGNTDNPRSVTVTANVTYTAYFESDEVPTRYTLTVESADMRMGTVSGGGTYNSGSTATLTATAASGYHFLRWQDGNTDNPRTVTVTADATYTAYFEKDLGISEVENAGLSLMVSDGYIKIVSTQGSIPAYTVNDVSGRCLYRGAAVEASEAVAAPQLASGVYFIQFVGLPAQKVVVVR
ncbi:MAG: S8 family serine peptidase [Bacteroidales bacterium]|nr:S8 family serine peptidase [Bacteroidales bacterium]